MKVNNQDLTGLGAASANRAQETHRSSIAGANSSSGGSGTDRIDFSSTLGSLSRAMMTFGSDRGAKVQSLAAQYNAGTYTADSAAVSRGLVSEALAQ
jgi:hypothetical protein